MKTNKATLGLLIATGLGVFGLQPRAGHAQGLASPTDAAADLAAPAGDDGIKLKGQWSLAERTTWEQIYADRTQYLNLMNSTCGTSIKMSFDHEAFRDRLPSVDSNRNEDWSASAMITEIRNLCLEGTPQKAAVAAKIGSIRFVRGPAKKHLLKGKKVVISLDLDANPREHVNTFRAWLESAL